MSYVGLGIIPILIVWERKGPERFIGLLGFLFSIFQLIIIVTMSQSIIDDFYPPKTSLELKTKPFDKAVYYFAMTLFLSGLILEIFEIGRIDNTLNGVELFWIFGLVGISIALLLTILLKKISPSIYHESSRRYSVHFGLFIGLFLLLPAIASFVNHSFAEQTAYCTEYKVISKSTGGRRNNSSWIFLKVSENEERFEVNRTFFNSVSNGQTIKLCKKKGKLGYDFVTEFKLSEK
ncbi:MAG: hypothetical protein EBR30_14545 [Cytophagia bacterium]|nr:hypothetical protein [Cytophagia bacterium]